MQLLFGVGGKIFAGFFFDDCFVIGDDFGQRFCADGGVFFDAEFVLVAFKDMLEFFGFNAEHDFAEQLNEAAMRVPRETFVARNFGNRFARFVVQAQIQNGIHHAGH